MDGAWGYLRKDFNDDHYSLNLFNSTGRVLSVGSPERSLPKWIDKIPDCSILMTIENARIFAKVLEAHGAEFELFEHKGFLKTS